MTRWGARLAIGSAIVVACSPFAGSGGVMDATDAGVPEVAVTDARDASDGSLRRFEIVVVEGAGVNWAQAQARAAALGGRLASIRSQAEADLVRQLLAEKANATVDRGNGIVGPWLGGRQDEGAPEPAGGWRWDDGAPFTFTDWHDSEPNNTKEIEDRLRLYVPEDTTLPFRWADDDPSSLSPSFVLERR